MRVPRLPPFLAGMWVGSQPLLLWALHFAARYVTVAVGCTAWLQQRPALAPRTISAALIAFTVAAAVLAGWWLWRACRTLSNTQVDLMPRLRLVTTVMALVGIVWTSIPLLMLPMCEAH